MPSREGRPWPVAAAAAWAKRHLFRLAYRMLVVYWFVRRPQTRGCLVVLLSEQRILLVRHTYKNGDEWDLPGGAIRKHEPPPAAASRELAEELGVDVQEIEYVASTKLYHRFHYDNVDIFVCRRFSGPPSPDLIEISQAEWFPLAEIPPNLSPLAAHVLDSVDVAAEPAAGVAAHQP